jgi:hypothetical protein
MLICIISEGQVNSISFNKPSKISNTWQDCPKPCGKINTENYMRWRIDRNMLWTGGLIFTAGAAKGFNEALQYKYNGFEEWFPHANDQWFYPTFSFRNKYKDGDPSKGAKFPLSTSALVMVTDQYHLNNFIQKSALTAALVFKIGERKKPLKHYLLDLLFYTACYQAGFHAIYEPIAMRNE